MLPSLWQQESANTPGRIGPVSKYGQPVGIGQTLPGTAEQMARKLGLPWNPSMLSGTDPASADYQKKVSAAYLREGLQKTGNLRDALRYYHGGPNRRLWGPKTNAYADSILGRISG